MTVKEVVKILLTCNQDAEVFIFVDQPLQQIESHSFNLEHQVYLT